MQSLSLAITCKLWKNVAQSFHFFVHMYATIYILWLYLGLNCRVLSNLMRNEFIWLTDCFLCAYCIKATYDKYKKTHTRHPENCQLWAKSERLDKFFKNSFFPNTSGKFYKQKLNSVEHLSECLIVQNNPLIGGPEGLILALVLT